MERAEMQRRIEALVADPGDVRGDAGSVIDLVIAALDDGELRVAEPHGGSWVTHAWIKHAILLYFQRRESRAMGDSDATAQLAAGALQPDLDHLGPSYFDKLPLKRNYDRLGVRCVPPGVARYGAFLARGVILMPGFVNIGAYIDAGSLVDTWATVGSCAQIGKNVHLSGGAGIGGVLEPPQAQPVIIEDGAFVGSRAIVVEGVFIGREAVLGAGVILTATTPIVDVRGNAPIFTHGRVEPRWVVIPGTLPKRFPAGEFGVPCALVIGERSESTDRKTSLERAIRDHGVAV